MNIKTIRLLKNMATAMVIAAMVFAFLIAGIRIFGVQVYGVLTGSMEPAYPTGSLIYVKKVDAEDLRVNDVITFSVSPNVIATHRIVELVPDEQNPSIIRYRTKGDANKDVDAALVSANNIIGKAMFAIPKMGYLANYIQKPPGIYVAILVCGLMIAFVFYTDSLENKKKTAPKKAPVRGYPPQRRPQAHRPAPQGGYARPQAYPRENAYRSPYQQRRPAPQRPNPAQRRPAQRRPEQRSAAPYESEYLRQMGYQYEDSYPGRQEYPERRAQSGRKAQTRIDRSGRR